MGIIIFKYFYLYFLLIADNRTNPMGVSLSFLWFWMLPNEWTQYKEVLQYLPDWWVKWRVSCIKSQRLIDSNKSQCQLLLMEQFIKMDQSEWRVHISVGLRLQSPESGDTSRSLHHAALVETKPRLPEMNADNNVSVVLIRKCVCLQVVRD